MAVPKLILQEKLRALGWPGLVGVLMLLAGLAYGVAVVLPAQKDRQRARDDAAQARIFLANTNLSKPLPAPEPEQPRDAFYRDFSTQTDVTRWIERIYAAAAAENLTLARGEYLLAPVADTRLVRYQISLPVQGEYNRIRRFIATTLTAVPNLSLDDLSLQRQNIGDVQIEGNLRLSLYLVKPS